MVVPGNPAAPPRRRVAAPPQRRIFHLLAASVFPSLLLFFPRTPVLIAALAVLIISVAGELLRLRFGGINRVFTRWLAPLLKPRESREITGSTYLAFSTVVVVALASREIAALALFFTAIGDPLAALVGERFGTHRIVGGRSVEGSAAFLAGALAIGGTLLSFGLATPLPVMLVGAAAAMLMELVPLGRLDDNLKIPLGSTAAMILAGLAWAG